MKITLLTIGKTEQDYLKEGIKLFEKRLIHYTQFALKELPGLKKTANLSPELIKEKEAKLIFRYINRSDCVVLLDECGKSYTSVGFANFLQKRMNAGTRELVFIVGGAWGFADSLKQRAHHLVSLSSMTFSHQMVRLFFVEQLYRGLTILRGENYHNE